MPEFDWPNILSAHEWVLVTASITSISIPHRNPSRFTQDKIFLHIKSNHHPFRHICWPFDLKGNAQKIFSLLLLMCVPPIRSEICSIVEYYYYTCMCNLCFDIQNIRKTRMKTTAEQIK